MTCNHADLSAGPREWLQARGEAPQERQAMEEATFEMLRLRLASTLTPSLRPLFSLPQYLYTLTVTDAEKAEKLTQSLPPGLARKDL